MKLFSTEQVSKYHPDKYADQISDAILTACLRDDKNSRVACECMVKGRTVILAGEITTTAKVDYAEIAKRVGKKLGYEVDTVIQQICTQSPEIAGGVKSGDELCAGTKALCLDMPVTTQKAACPTLLIWRIELSVYWKKTRQRRIQHSKGTRNAK